ncbi:TetR family transcriptional regulator [Rhodococcus sp. T2V]|uniref:TetR/AcrR family transcriptional regulator n=1 Tax=Rhodococcus sp. T2V TaxID=3034164 RepID=UPI0023E1F566|nr:TetR/AcrR family transcriptional regulator [Rhodococcus sp. T2V]MDF3309708.1 TetR family transcriptional regulator [Rhodococcus sp. T2V]
MSFQRARTEEQRVERRRVILETAAAMLAEMPVSDVALNELSRRVGLAKSNVLRYFESREAVLLVLLDGELEEWSAELTQIVVGSKAALRRRSAKLAKQMAATMAARPVLCDLISAQAAVLERNVSAEVALRHKQATVVTVERLAALVTRGCPELSSRESYKVVAHMLLMASAVWPHSQPSQAVQEAYALDSKIAKAQMGFVETVADSVDLCILGLVSRH